MRLWYYLSYDPQTSKDTKSYLEVRLESESDRNIQSKVVTIQDVTGDLLGNGWRPLKLYVVSRGTVQKPNNITISMYSYGGTQIAIDDLLLLERACEVDGTCDFESGMLAWPFCLL